jgi:circadian clock protein KaiB
MSQLLAAEPNGDRAAAAAGEPGPVRLRLYVSERPRTRQTAIEAARAVVGALGAGAELEVIDVVDAPGRAEEDRIIATPTLIKVAPAPEARLIGQMPEAAAVLRHLGL